MPLAEVTDGAEVRDVFTHNHPEGHVGFTAGHQAAGGEGAGGIAVQEERDQHGGMIGRLASVLGLIGLEERLEIHLGDDIQEEVDQVVLGQPVPRRGREEKRLVRIPRPELLAHEGSHGERVLGLLHETMPNLPNIRTGS